MSTPCDYQRVGPAFGEGGSAVVFAGEVVEVQFALEEKVGSEWVSQDLTGRAFAFRVVGRGGSVATNLAGVNDIGAGVAAFTISAAASAALLTGAETRHDYFWEFCEVTDAGRQVIYTGDMAVILLADPDASLPSPTTGAAVEAITRYTIRAGQPVVTLRYIGQKGDQGYAGWSPIYALVADGVRLVWQVDDWTGGQGTAPATGQYVGAAGLVDDIEDGVDIAAGLNEAGDTVLEQISTAGTTQVGLVNAAGTTQTGLVNTAGTTQVAAVNSAGSTQVAAVNSAGGTQVSAVQAAGDAYVTPTTGGIDVAGAAALAAISAAEALIVTPTTGTIPVREAAALDAIADAEAAALIRFETWALLNAVSGTVEGQGARCFETDTGLTHTDPVTGSTVQDRGAYRWKTTAPSGWKRIAALEADDASISADEAAASALALEEDLGHRATQTPASTSDPIVILGNGNQAVIEVDSAGVWSVAGMPISGGDLRPFDLIPLVYPITRRAEEHIQVSGMSLADGDASTVYSTTTPVATLYKPSTTVRNGTSSTRNALVEATQETICSRMGKELARRFAVEDGVGYAETVWSFAVASQDSLLISAINTPGQTVFDRMDTQFTNAKTASVAAGAASLGMHFLATLAGGAEAARARATITADYITWQANAETKAQLRSGLADPLHLLAAPTNYNMLTYPNAALALFDADNASDKIWACFAEHMLWMYVADGAHYQERGYQYAGALFARAEKDIYNGHAPRRVWPRFKEAILRADGKIFLPYTTPTPLMKRYKGMLATTNDGYALTNAGAGAITDVEIWRGHTVILHTTGVDPVTNPTNKVEYATRETPLLYTLTGGGFGNITDSTGEILEFRGLKFPAFHAMMPHDALIRSIDA